jgi:hypothetical protein
LTFLGEITFSESSSNPILEKIVLPAGSHIKTPIRKSSSSSQARHRQPLNEREASKLLKMCTSRKNRLIELTMPLLPRGALSYGIHKIPFSFVLQPMLVGSCGKVVSYRDLQETNPLYETFHGDLISIQYKLYVSINRGYFSRLLEGCLEIKVEVPNSIPQNYNELPPAYSVHLTPSDLVVCSEDRMLDKDLNSIYNPSFQTATSLWMKQIKPIFDVEVEIDSSTLNLNTLLNGKLTVHSCNCLISSIGIYLRRIESLFLQKNNKSINDGTETPLKTIESIIKMLQIAHGNLRKKVEIPIVMEYPNLLASPTASYRAVPSCTVGSGAQGSFIVQIAYEISVVISFENDWKAEKSIPVALFRE